MQRLLLLGLALCPLVNPAAAEGLFGGGNRLDPSFCKAAINIRQTVIYVDDSIIATGDTGWARTIYDKLRSTLVPGEPTALVELSPMNGQSTQLWSGCWPDYTTLERAKIRASSHLFLGRSACTGQRPTGFLRAGSRGCRGEDNRKGRAPGLTDND